MSVQEIKLNITDLVNRIEDEDKLQACYIVIATIAKDNKTNVREPRTPKKVDTQSSRFNAKPKVKRPLAPKINNTSSRINAIEPVPETVKSQENVPPHDLSLVFLANHMFKDSETLSEVGEIAFESRQREARTVHGRLADDALQPARPGDELELEGVGVAGVKRFNGDSVALHGEQSKTWITKRESETRFPF